MGNVICLIIVIAIISTFFGVKILMRLYRKPKEPPIPEAHDVNPDVILFAQKKVEHGIITAWKVAAFVFGGFLIVWPWIIVYAIATWHDSGSHSKGRVLRIRSRARLPEPAKGEGWSADGIVLHAVLSPAERRVLGELWLLTARMEHASIAAFSQLSLQLSALGAPARLLEWSHRAALEEIGHARRCFAIASAIAGEPHRAGPIVELGRSRSGAIDLTRLAIGSLVDGCLAEGMAADVAARSASTAREPAIRETLALIAREEAGHAELAWAVLAWCLDAGDAAVHRAVATRVEALSRELAPRLPDIAGIDDATLAHHGVVGQDALGAIATARCTEVAERARRMLAPVLALAA